MTTTVTVIAAAKQDALEFHAPGCAHLTRKAVLEANERQMTVADLRAFTAEAAELGERNPVAPCLRAAVR